VANGTTSAGGAQYSTGAGSTTTLPFGSAGGSNQASAPAAANVPSNLAVDFVTVGQRVVVTLSPTGSAQWQAPTSSGDNVEGGGSLHLLRSVRDARTGVLIVTFEAVRAGSVTLSAATRPCATHVVSGTCSSQTWSAFFQITKK
jgi:hypothetical protein